MSACDISPRVEEASPVSLQTKARRRCCKIRYRPRWFYSRGAFLVAVWVALVHISIFFPSDTKTDLLSFAQLQNSTAQVWASLASLLPTAVSLLSALLSGWLADARFGNYYMTKVGIIFVFIATILQCGFSLSLYIVQFHFPSELYIAILTITKSIGFCGYGACIVNLLQLGLDQMPDASASNICSYIAWFVFSLYLGGSITNIPITFSGCLNDSGASVYMVAFRLFPVLCMAVVLCSDFLVSPQWLIIVPNSSQSLKNICKVLCFARKHKTPVNRSALTYWEEDIPSRIDLGKSRYGGPFTTEQVEDVKTILRLLVVFVPGFFTATSISLSFVDSFPSKNGTLSCGLSLIENFSFDYNFLSVLVLLLYEFAIYPFVAHIIPSALKRIGAALFIVVLGSSALLVVRIISNPSEVGLWNSYPSSVITAILTFVYLTSMFEFMCAQSPYSMRSLLIGYMVFLFSFTLIVCVLLIYILSQLCVDNKRCEIISTAVSVFIGVVSLVLHCLLAHWYKRRVRDDIDTPHRWVEDVYDRYLSQPSATNPSVQA